MLTFNNKPFITLDPYLPVEKMLSLRHEWEFLLSSKSNAGAGLRTGVWNAGGHAPDDIAHNPAIHREKDMLYYAYRKANEDRKTDLDLDKHLSYFEKSKDQDGLGRYLKLRYKSFDPYNILNVRKTTGNFYSADAYTFTEEDWQTYQWVDYMDEFPNLKNFIVDELPFDRIGIVTIFFNEHYIPQGYHRDFNYFPLEKGNNPKSAPHRQELIWFRFDLDRPFYLFDMDEKTGTIKEQVPVQGYSVFFNHHNWHGSFDNYPNSSITVKVEGKFTDEFRKQIGIDNLEYYS
jgi:hypothetical protein